MRKALVVAAMLTVLLPWGRHAPAWPDWCSIDGKGDFIAWLQASHDANRALMYAVCESGPLGT